MNGSRTGYRIAMVAACPFPSLRGSQVLIRELAEALAAAGHEVHVVAYPAGEHLVPVKGMAIHRARTWWGLDGCGSWWAKLVLDVALILALYRVVRAHAIDVIHAHNYEGPLVGYAVRWLLGTPVVYHTHNAMADELPYYFQGSLASRLARRFGSLLDRVVPLGADHCLALTDELSGYLRRKGVPRPRITVVPPAISQPAAGGLSASRLFPHNEVVLYAGNIDPYQGIDVLLLAYARLRERRPGVLLVIAAHPAKAPAVRGRLAELAQLPGVRVVMAQTFGATRPILNRADVVVCCRSSWSGFPIKLLNFMSFGRAIVVCKSAAKAVSDGVSGVVVPDEDDKAMADAIEMLLADGQRRAELGAAARRAVQRGHSWAVAVSLIETVYAGVVGDDSAGGIDGEKRRFGGVQNHLMASTEDRISPRAQTRRTGSE
ncbi:MAG: glycosyltransferase family 4 protein [Deltaproteobacteria bacterium]|nr:glycosyltransferase family 4 protein [Deltaproteobacteria bacterium]